MTAPTVDLDWRLRGKCRGVDPDEMYPERVADEPRAKARCNGCPVATECFIESIRTHDFEGVRAGMTGKERKEWAKANLPASRTCRGCRKPFRPRTHNQQRCTGCSREHNYHKPAVA
ncbi:WhiB family transcriptional regulator [Micromonospora sp. NPDC023644]|uniref:WhiB family transcriptional regulator n=1 Tax=Micromonospora sp. NPDC023644 TaxID=3154321 RepID=UPI0033CC6EE7